MTSGVENGKEEVTLLGRGQGEEEKTPRVQNIKRSPLPGSRKRGSSGCNLGTSLHSGSDAGGLRESSAKWGRHVGCLPGRRGNSKCSCSLLSNASIFSPPRGLSLDNPSSLICSTKLYSSFMAQSNIPFLLLLEESFKHAHRWFLWSSSDVGWFLRIINITYQCHSVACLFLSSFVSCIFCRSRSIIRFCVFVDFVLFLFFEGTILFPRHIPRGCLPLVTWVTMDDHGLDVLIHQECTKWWYSASLSACISWNPPTQGDFSYLTFDYAEDQFLWEKELTLDLPPFSNQFWK